MVPVGGSRPVERVVENRVGMIQTECAICGVSQPVIEVYDQTFEHGDATFARFSARRTPDRIHYRIVRCARCGLLRSDPVLPDGELARLYEGSEVTYTEEALFAGATYEQYLRKYLPMVPAKRSLLEIGCGNGYFLERALHLGFHEAHGVEPSKHAIELAPAHLRSNIVNDVFRDGLYPSGYFDVVCAFQVFDHVAHPNEMLQACRRILKPGGLALFINHDAGAWTNRFLGELSPIVDVEHIYLYDTETMRRIFCKHGFDVRATFSVRNQYPLYYWCKMAPLPSFLKSKLTEKLHHAAIRRWAVSLKVGNLGLVASSPGPVVQ
jgi:2-polyprenyl-3-methyl-5-hydroxy-6-metoxy-1,4-benzoquinol methylase